MISVGDNLFESGARVCAIGSSDEKKWALFCLKKFFSDAFLPPTGVIVNIFY